MSDKRILIVEDEKVLRDVYEIILNAAGYNVATAVNGKEALKAVADHNPSLVILDILMPIMDGREFMQSVNLKAHPKMKVIVCSNTSDSAVRDDMFTLGADQVVLKADMIPSDLITLVKPYFEE